jgi:superfamily II DNA/RNA helicase
LAAESARTAKRAFYGTHIMSFETLHLDPALTQAIQDQGYENPTPIQSQAIPLVLSGCTPKPQRKKASFGPWC